MAAPDTLRIDRPCPFVPTSRNRNDGGFHCRSCNKTVIDFRGKSREEIRAACTADTCGIFTSDQLTGQLRMPWRRKVIFHALAVLSILGMSIRPMAAQTDRGRSASPATAITKPDRCDRYQQHKEFVRESKPAQPRKGLFRKKKRIYRTIGCPSF